jgi:hypothetical protein
MPTGAADGRARPRADTIRAMRRLVAAIPLLLALFAGPLPHASGDGEEHRNWKAEAAYKAIQAEEAKALAGLLRTALKEDFRRQAWFIADRLLAAKPSDAEAAAAQEKWRDDELMLGMDPTPEFLRKLALTLGEFGDKYFHFGEMLNGAGLDATHYYELHVLSRTYNSPAAAGNPAFKDAGFVWLGTFLDHEEQPLMEAAGKRFKAMSFPPAWDDDYLKVKIRWPEARLAAAGPWRLLTDLKPVEAVRLLAVLEVARDHLVEELGGTAAIDTKPVDVLVFSEGEAYEKFGGKFVPEKEHTEFALASSWYDRANGRIFASWRHRTNPWIGEDATVLAEAAKVIAKRHFGQNASAGVSGRGAWLLQGLGGALEGLFLDRKAKRVELDPSRSWRLAAAKALRAEKALLPWEEFLELDGKKAKDLPRKSVKVAFRGASFDAKDVDVAAAQATAFVVGLMKADKGKGAKKVGDLLRDLYKRDSLPDLEKTLGWKKGRWQAECEKAIDAATGL